MDWKDRRKEAAITCPNGERFVFIYGDVERERTESASAFKAANIDGQYVARYSSGGDSFPLNIRFQGPDYDIIGERFNEATKAPGVFFLEHPIFPNIKRVQLISIKQRIGAVSGDNFVTFECSFLETVEIGVIQSTVSPATEVNDGAKATNKAAGNVFEENTDPEDSSELADLKQKALEIMAEIRDGFNDIIIEYEDYYTEFESQYLSVTSEITSLTDASLDLALAVSQFINTPARLESSIKQRMETFKEIGDAVIEKFQIIADDTLSHSKNNASSGIMFSAALMSSMCIAAINSDEFNTKADVLEVIGLINELNDSIVTFIDDSHEYFNSLDNPIDRPFNITEAKASLLSLVSLATGRLYDIAFQLKVERTVELDADTATVLIVHKYYGYSDDNFDYFVKTNSLKGDEFFLLRAGREIKYYI